MDKTIEIGYLLKFINRWIGHSVVRPVTSLAQKVPSKSPYRSEKSQITIHWNKGLNQILQRRTTQQKPLSEKETRSILHQKPKRHENNYITSHCVDQFKYICVATYIRSSTRDLQIGVSEHVPKWLQKRIKSNDYYQMIGITQWIKIKRAQ